MVNDNGSPTSRKRLWFDVAKESRPQATGVARRRVG